MNFTFIKIISLRGDVVPNKTSLAPQLLLKCLLYQARKVGGHVFLCKWYRVCLLLCFWNCSNIVVLFVFHFFAVFKILIVNFNNNKHTCIFINHVSIKSCLRGEWHPRGLLVCQQRYWPSDSYKGKWLESQIIVMYVWGQHNKMFYRG